MSASPLLVLAFVPAVVAIFFACGRWPRLSQAALVVASFTFIALLDRAAMPWLLGTLVVTYLLGLALGAKGGSGHPWRAALAFTGVAGNLAVLAYYKWTAAILPLGLSFFTLQQVIYLLDTWRGDPPARRLLDYLTLVTFFPKLAAGPFVRHVTFLEQFARERFRPCAEDLTWGLALITIGVLKKGLIAAALAPHASAVFDGVARGASATPADAWAGAVAYALELYFDFSAYSDMAIGTARLFGIRLPINFDSPYRAPGIIEFWKRWHITLSKVLFEFVYFPLAASARRGDAVGPYLALVATMLACGLWHGFGWTFATWGALHGCYLCVNHGWRAYRRRGRTLPRPSRWRRGGAMIVTFVAVVVAWVFFRAADLGVALRILGAMIDWGAGGLRLELFASGAARHGIAAISIALAIAWFTPNSQTWAAWIVAMAFPPRDQANAAPATVLVDTHSA